MKAIIIGDLHGKHCWKQVDVNKFDKVIFIGDFVDAWHETNDKIFNNLLDIIQLKRDFPDKVILLLGNHCCQYVYYPHFRCSGFRPEAQPDLTSLFKGNRSLFQMAYQEGNYLFTHAGVSNSWLKKYQEEIDRYTKKFDLKTLADAFNVISETKDNWILHEFGPKRGGLRGDYGGVTWADIDETRNDFIPNFHQVCGHTPIKEITTFVNEGENSSITYIDVLDKKTEFYEIELSL